MRSQILVAVFGETKSPVGFLPEGEFAVECCRLGSSLVVELPGAPGPPPAVSAWLPSLLAGVPSLQRCRLVQLAQRLVQLAQQLLQLVEQRPVSLWQLGSLESESVSDIAGGGGGGRCLAPVADGVTGSE